MRQAISRPIKIAPGHEGASMTWYFVCTGTRVRVLKITQNYLISKRHKWRETVLYDHASPTLQDTRYFVEPPEEVVSQVLDFYKSQIHYKQ